MPNTDSENERAGGRTPTWRGRDSAPESRSRERSPSTPALRDGARTRFSPPPPPADSNAPVPPGVDTTPTTPRTSSRGSSPSYHGSPSVRVPLSSAGHHLGGVRIAIVDTDPTRLDALALTLRARRAEVHISSLNPRKSHFRLLRRFCPHALLIDEEVISGSGAEFLKAFRADPFLSHVQLIAVRFDRLFRERSGTASIESIKVLLEPLGRQETYLLSRLGPRCEIEFDFDQIPPHLLLRILATRAAPTRMECSRLKETLVWTIHRGMTGSALLRVGASIEQRRLTSDEAIQWLLEHKNCHVVLTQPDDFDELSSASEVVPIIEEKMSGLWSISQVFSSGSETSTTSEAAKTTPKVSGARIVQTGGGSNSPSQAPVVTTLHPAELGAPRSTLSFLAKFTATPRTLVLSGVIAAGLTLGIVFRPPSGTDAPSRSIQSARPELAGVETGQVSTPSQVDAPPAVQPLDLDAPTEQEIAPATSTPVDADHGAALFVVPERSVEPCEVQLSEGEADERTRSTTADLYWRRGQRLLVAGKNDEAFRELCKSAFLAPGGGGAEQLAELYLTMRAPTVAALHLGRVLEERPDSRTARELWGDILNQQGRLKEARSAWLRAFRVAEDDEKTTLGLGRHWLKLAQQTSRAGDLPRAERYARRALTIDRTSSEARALLSRVLLRQKETSLARALDAP